MSLKLCDLEKENIKLQSFYSKEYEEFDMSLHSHNYLEIMYVVSGKCKIHVLKNSVDQEIILNAQQFIVIDFDVFHKLTVTQHTSIMNIELKPVNMPYLCCLPFSALKESSPTLVEFLNSFSTFTVLEDVASVNKIMRMIYSENLKTSLKDSLIITQSLINMLFVNIARCKDVVATSHGTTHFNKAIKYINEHIDDKIFIQDIADNIKINKAYLHRIFKEQTDDTINNYINKLKIERAKKLMVSTELPLVDIAATLGFNNRQNFFFAFKKQTGMSPQTYRNNVQKHSFEVYNGIYQHQIIQSSDE